MKFWTSTSATTDSGLGKPASLRQLWVCHRLKVCISPKFICWTLILSVLEGLWKACRSWKWSPHEWCRSSFVRGSLAPFNMWEHSKKTAVYKPGSKPSPATESADALSVDFLDSKLWEINACCLKTSKSMVFQYSIQNGLRNTSLWTGYITGFPTYRRGLAGRRTFATTLIHPVHPINTSQQPEVTRSLRQTYITKEKKEPRGRDNDKNKWGEGVVCFCGVF